MEINPGELGVVVDWRQRQQTSLYRVVPVNGKYKRYGTARWYEARFLTGTGMESHTGSIRTYRANQTLEEETGDRGCDCQCCAHVAMDRGDYSNSGRWLGE